MLSYFERTHKAQPFGPPARNSRQICEPRTFLCLGQNSRGNKASIVLALFWGGKKPHSWALTPQIHLPPEAIFYCALCTYEQWLVIATVTGGSRQSNPGCFPRSLGNLSRAPNNHAPGRRKTYSSFQNASGNSFFFPPEKPEDNNWTWALNAKL